jgi:hypothetical protein
MERIKMSRITISILLSFISCVAVSAQQQTDSLQTRRLDELVIEGQKDIDVERLPAIEGTRIWSGKKNEVINPKIWMQT